MKFNSNFTGFFDKFFENFVDKQNPLCYNRKSDLRVCWNRQTGTFEGRVSLTYGFKSRHSHHVAVNYAAFKNPGLWLGFFHILRYCSYFAKRHARLTCSVVNVLTTVRGRYHLFASAPSAHVVSYLIGLFSLKSGEINAFIGFCFFE